MEELQAALAVIEQWQQQGQTAALATVINTWGSAPRRPGALLALSSSGDIYGSVSAGCVETAVIEAAQGCLRHGRPRWLHVGVTNDTAFEVGLACGGDIDIFVERWSPALHQALQRCLDQAQRCTLITVVRGPADWLGSHVVLHHDEIVYSTLPARLLASDYAQLCSAGASALVELAPRDITCFVQQIAPAPTLAIIGGNHIAQALAQLAPLIGYQVALIDPRPTFANAQRFPTVAAISNAWPAEGLAQLEIDARTAIVVLTHDPKFDDEALEQALCSPAGYVGALGSRRTQAQRRERLLERGLPLAAVERIHGPVGLDIGAQTPAEIAVAIVAELISVIRKEAARPWPASAPLC